MKAVQHISGRGQVEMRPYSPPKATGKERKKYLLAAGILLAVSLLTSLCLAAYTPVSNWFHSLRMKELIAAYDQRTAELPEAQRAEILQSARAYNASLPEGSHFQLNLEETDRYSAQLGMMDAGMMGYIQIPKLGLSLPIYHAASESVMEEAVGHLPGSSLPVGGESCHTVLCAHRDLSSAYLFHDLDKLGAGDTFTLTVLGESITYEVDQVKVVLPEETGDLAIEAGEDHCTLVTCHPHGSSAYRLLVRGTRTEC